MIAPGNKIAKALGIRVIETSEKRTKAVEVVFEFEESPGNKQRLNWLGWLTHNALESTMRTLVEVMEFNGDDQIVQVPTGDRREGMFVNQDCVNRKKDYQLVVEIEQYDGKDRARIKWVNNVGGGQFAGCQPEVVQSVFQEIGFKAAFLAAKQGAGAAAPKAPTQPASPLMAPMQSEPDLPF